MQQHRAGLVLLVAFIQSAASMRLGALPTRRAVLLATAASLQSAMLAPPAAALTGKELYGTIKDPREGYGWVSKLNPEDERIIKGAIRNDLVDPTEIQACLKLESITTSDIRAAAEVRLANAEIDKMIQEGKKAGRDVSALEKSYSVGSQVEQRIGSRAMLFQDRFISECALPVTM